MKFFINDPNTYRSVNNKGLELNKWISVFKHFSVPSQLSLDAFIEEIRAKAAELDKKFPRSTQLKVDVTFRGQDGYYIHVYPDQNPDKSVFSLTIHPVRGSYTFSEPVNAFQLEEKGGRK